MCYVLCISYFGWNHFAKTRKTLKVISIFLFTGSNNNPNNDGEGQARKFYFVFICRCIVYFTIYSILLFTDSGVKDDLFKTGAFLEVS